MWFHWIQSTVHLRTPTKCAFLPKHSIHFWFKINATWRTPIHWTFFVWPFSSRFSFYLPNTSSISNSILRPFQVFSSNVVLIFIYFSFVRLKYTLSETMTTKKAALTFVNFFGHMWHWPNKKEKHQLDRCVLFMSIFIHTRKMYDFFCININI